VERCGAGRLLKPQLYPERFPARGASGTTLTVVYLVYLLAGPRENRLLLDAGWRFRAAVLSLLAFNTRDDPYHRVLIR